MRRSLRVRADVRCDATRGSARPTVGARRHTVAIDGVHEGGVGQTMERGSAGRGSSTRGSGAPGSWGCAGGSSAGGFGEGRVAQGRRLGRRRDARQGPGARAPRRACGGSRAGASRAPRASVRRGRRGNDVGRRGPGLGLLVGIWWPPSSTPRAWQVLPLRAALGATGPFAEAPSPRSASACGGSEGLSEGGRLGRLRVVRLGRFIALLLWWTRVSARALPVHRPGHPRPRG